MRRRLLHAGMFVAAAALSVLAAVGAAVVIERHAGATVMAALEAAGEGWVEVAADGLQVRLSGTADTEARRFRAVTIAAGVVDGARVIDAMTVAEPPPPGPPAFVLEVLASADAVLLIGLVPKAMEGTLAARIAALRPGVAVADMTETADYLPAPGWDTAVEFGLSLVADLPRAKISIAADRVAVTAVGASLAEKRRLEAEFARRAPEGLRLAMAISAPRPILVPFTLRFLIDADGARFDACSADDEAAAARIIAAAVAAGALGKTACTIGLGVPSPSWGEAAAAAIAAVAELGEGSVTFRDADVTLVAGASVPAETFDRVAGELKARLPRAFALTAQRLDPPAPAEDAPVPEFTARLARDGTVELRGRLADERMRDTVDAFARLRFGADAVLTATRLGPGVPDGWPVRVLTGLTALGELAEGTLRVRPDVLEVTGVTGRQDATEVLSRLVAERLGPAADFRLVLRYDRRLDPEAGPLSPAECLAEVAALQAGRKLSFAPGSATLTPESRAMLDAIAEVLRGCGAVPLEIAGHTDSQGRAEANLRLSQSRAEAVLQALYEAGVDTRAMTARGYGSTQPVADNATEAGREANRRIEFRLPPGLADAPAAAAPAPPAGPAGEAAGRAGAESAIAIDVSAPDEDTIRPRARPRQD